MLKERLYELLLRIIGADDIELDAIGIELAEIENTLRGAGKEV